MIWRGTRCSIGVSIISKADRQRRCNIVLLDADRRQQGDSRSTKGIMGLEPTADPVPMEVLPETTGWTLTAKE